jgi:hypothetical protein
MDPECYINADVIAVEGLTRLPMHCKRNRRTRCCNRAAIGRSGMVACPVAAG